jgi:hypothetical protein
VNLLRGPYLRHGRCLMGVRPARYETMLPRKGIALLYEWAVVRDEPKSVEDIFLPRMPLEVVREVDVRWTETALRVRRSNW